MLGHKYLVDEQDNFPNGKNTKLSGLDDCHPTAKWTKTQKQRIWAVAPGSFSLQPLCGDKEAWVS